ncbi:MAG: DHHA1 domain-containing protein, partial [Chromatiales bacterium]|nr:DHHA1 domain-containing protein [Chromatiales bacterium]
MNPLIIFHAHCLDGFGAAYAAWLHFGEGNCELHPASHGKGLPECDGRKVYILDFSYRRNVMEELCEHAESVIVIDHHISAFKDMQGLDDEIKNLTLDFTMERSGAVLAWEYFHPEKSIPDLLLDVEDRDIWKFEREGSADRTAALMSYKFDLKQWHQWCNDGEAYDHLGREGSAINRFRRQMIERHKKRAIMAEIAGYTVPIVNGPSEIISELVGELSVGYPFAAGFQDNEEKRSWSLRSDGDNGIDVSQIAAEFGGGGHRNAAGFA